MARRSSISITRDPRWFNELEVLRIRGGDLTKLGANLSLQDHGADVWFRNLRWRAIPASEKLVSENLTPMPIPDERFAQRAGSHQQDAGEGQKGANGRT
jgi:hypothetical protein